MNHCIMARMCRGLCLFLLLSSPWEALAAPGEGDSTSIGYAQATGYFKKDSRPSLYQPLNLLDARENTAWCGSGADPTADTLSVGFKSPVRIDEIRIYTGNGFDAAGFKSFARARKLSIRGPESATTFTVNDERGFQGVALNPPLQGTHFTFEVLESFPGEEKDAPVCITDLVFFSGGKALNGAWLTPRLKLDRARAPLMGTWFAGYEGAPDRVLSFFFDGTFRYVYEPFEANTTGKTLTGTYDVKGHQLVLEPAQEEPRTLQFRREKKDSGQTLSFPEKLPPDMAPEFRDRP